MRTDTDVSSKKNSALLRLVEFLLGFQYGLHGYLLYNEQLNTISVSQTYIFFTHMVVHMARPDRELDKNLPSKQRKTL